MNDNTLSILSDYIRDNSGINSVFGYIRIQVKDILGQGGNGIVYSGKINETNVAIKFLLNYNSEKLERFKAEYLNVNMTKDKLVNVVNYIHYGILLIEDIQIPYIIMKKYKSSLKFYRKSLKEIRWEDVNNLFMNLCDSLKSLEQCGIIHRDLKPENILIDESNKYIVTDFGIAHFSSPDFPIKNLTKKGDRLANFGFSAPEQFNGTKVTYSTDIYSLAQILYWFVFGQTNRGIGGKSIQDIYDNKEARYLNNIIYKCLNNDPKNRCQTIDEINNEIDNMKYSEKEINPFDDMSVLNEIVRSTIPEFYMKGGYTEDPKEINELMIKINNCKLNRNFIFNTGISNNSISCIKHLENGNYLLNYQEIKITKIWGLFGDSLYNDILIFETEEPDPYIINGEEYYGVAVINDTTIIPVENIGSGYVRYRGKVYPVGKLKIEERLIYHTVDDSTKYFAIGAFANCTTILANDRYIEDLQKYESINERILIKLKQNISKNKSHVIEDYL